MLNPRQVEAFRAVMTTGSVTSAAITTHVTQPAVSRLIRDLEVTLKLALVEPRGNRLSPTAQADHPLPKAERTFVVLSRLSQVPEEHRAPRAGPLLIAMPP